MIYWINKTKSLKYDKNKKFHEIVKEQEKKEKEELMQKINDFRKSVMNSGRDIRFIFEKLDLDNNGTLTPDEIEAAFLLLGIGKLLLWDWSLDGYTNKIIKYSDTNQDGRIDYDEFCNFLYQTESEMESAMNKVDFGESSDNLEDIESEVKFEEVIRRA